MATEYASMMRSSRIEEIKAERAERMMEKIGGDSTRRSSGNARAGKGHSGSASRRL
jgi:hypothetical protein